MSPTQLTQAKSIAFGAFVAAPPLFTLIAVAAATSATLCAVTFLLWRHFS